MKFFTKILILFLFSVSVAFSQNGINRSSKHNQNKSLKIISKPRAEYPKQDTGTICVTGVVRLRIRFLDSGKVGEIQALNNLPYGLTESAINAAQKIKFSPDMREGKPITVTKIIEYSFSIY